MLLRFACAVVSLVVTSRAVACAITVTPSPQERVRAAVIIAEGKATGEQLTFAVGRVWKGSAPATVTLRQVSQSNCDELPRTVDGNDYLLFINDPESEIHDGATVYHKAVDVIPLESPESHKVLRFLAGSVRVSRADVVAMLRKWQYNVVSDRAFAEWLRQTVPVADVGDWDEDGPVPSIALQVLMNLDNTLNESEDVPMEKNPCVAFARTQVVPYFIEVLGTRPVSEERMVEIEAELDEKVEEYEQCLP